jgi:hypothetical protein
LNAASNNYPWNSLAANNARPSVGHKLFIIIFCHLKYFLTYTTGKKVVAALQGNANKLWAKDL